MAIIVDKDGNVVTVENEPEEARSMFPNLREGGVTAEEVLAAIIQSAVTVDDNVVATLTTGDLNTITTPGVYLLAAGNNITHKPNVSTRAAKLIIISVPSGLYEFYLLSGTVYAALFYRIQSGTTWGGWQSIATATDMNAKVNWISHDIAADASSRNVPIQKGFNIIFVYQEESDSFGVYVYYLNASSISHGIALHSASFVSVSSAGSNVTITRDESSGTAVIQILRIYAYVPGT